MLLPPHQRVCVVGHLLDLHVRLKLVLPFDRGHVEIHGCGTHTQEFVQIATMLDLSIRIIIKSLTVRVLTGPVGPPQKPRSGVVSFVGPPQKPRSGVVSFVDHRSTGTGDRHRAGDRVLGFLKCRHDQLWGRRR
jgi:hypothetical protein